MSAQATMRRIDITGLTFTTPPRGQGQIVTRSYARLVDLGGDPEIVRRTHDASIGCSEYHVAQDLGSEEVPGLNGPPKVGQWRAVTV